MNKRKNAVVMTPEESRKFIGSKLNFAAAEAYKLLRTNLNFSAPDKNGCRIIGVTSSLQSEGKSMTSINTAYTLAQSGQKVLLLEADLRLPTIGKRLRLASRPGLSNCLAGQVSVEDTLQKSDIIDGLTVMTAGDVPPNPAELLESDRMKTLLDHLATKFDTIMIDLPPVGVVSDAVVLSKLVSGYILVVRQKVCDKATLDEVVRQLEFVNAKILGFVMTDADYEKKSYKHYGRYHYSKAGSANASGHAVRTKRRNTGRRSRYD